MAMWSWIGGGGGGGRGRVAFREGGLIFKIGGNGGFLFQIHV